MTTIEPGSRREELHELIARVDLPRLVERYSPLVRRTGSTWLYRCPSPDHDDRSPSFTVTIHRSREFARCWSRCGWSGDALDLVEWMERLDTSDAIRWLRDYLGDCPRPVTPRIPERPRRDAPDLSTMETRTPPEHVASVSLDRYLDRRGVPESERPSIVQRFSLSTVLDSRGEIRIRHPYLVPDATGGARVGWWQDRALGASPIRWLSPPGTTSIPYNLPALESSEIRAVVVCEGPGDTITATRALGDDPEVVAIGLPGASSWKQIYEGLVRGLHVLIATDPDEAGERLAERITSTVPSARRVELETLDITDLALEEGIGAGRERIIGAIPSNRVELSDRELIEHVLAMFTGSTIVEEVTR